MRLATPLRASVQVFRNPDLARLQIAWAGVSFSTWAFAIGLAVYAFNVGGAGAVGLAALVRLLPGALASPFAGLLGDRHSRRVVLLVSSVTGALMIGGAGMAIALGTGAAVPFALAGAFTVATAPYVPAEGALLPAVARTPQELSAANIAHSTMDNAGFLVGSMAAGVLLAVASPEAVFFAAAAVAVLTAVPLAGISQDTRRRYLDVDAAGILHETALGARSLVAHRGLRLIALTLTVLVFFEGAADVLIVIVALDLVGLGEESVGYLNAGWGVGAIVGGVALAVLLDRGNLSAGLVAGSVVIGVAMALPGAWPVALASYAAWIVIGVGYTFVEVTARTLLQRLGSDEVLARVLGALETSRLAARALGAIVAPGLVALGGTRGALVVIAAILPLFAALRWTSLRGFEIGAPVAERPYALLRGDPLFEPLPVATVERLSHDLVEIEVGAGKEIITEGERGDRFYLIDSGEVEVLEGGAWRRTQREGESFGEIALLRDIPRTATVRAVRDTRLYVLDREHFIAAVTGHARSHQAAEAVIAARRSGSAPAG